MAGNMANEVERTMRTIFKRCVQCPPETPTCPNCARDEICSLVPQSCDQCAHMTCIANPSPSPTRQTTNVGAIAGGVIGGVVFMGVVIFIFWRFWIKKRRAQQEAEGWEEDDIATQKGAGQLHAMRSDGASTRTRGSIASSILTRASNIIHIAYIPGVTNRNGGSGHNSILAPVPPIPAAFANRTPQATTPKSPLSNEGDALFFRPGSIRDSSYTDSSSIRSGKRDNKRDTQYTTHSITPSLARSSMMSDVYRDDATTEPMPAIQVQRVLPRMVSVKSASSSPSLESSPSPSLGTGPKVMMPGQSSITNSPSSGGQFAKATQVTVGGKGKGRSPISRTPSNGSASTKPAKSSPLVEAANESDDEDEHARARKSLIKDSTATAANPTPLIQPLESPFFDATELQTSASSASQAQRPNPYAAMSASVGAGSRRIQRNNADARGPGGLSAVIEEAAKRASADPEHEGIGGKRDQSPFSDEHATK